MNIHCQPCRPAAPSKLVISSPDKGPPIRPAMPVAQVKIAITLALRSVGYQRVR